MYSIYFRSLQDFYVLEDTYGWKKGQMLHPLSEGAGGTFQAAAAAGSFASVPEKKKKIRSEFSWHVSGYMKEKEVT